MLLATVLAYAINATVNKNVPANAIVAKQENALAVQNVIVNVVKTKIIVVAKRKFLEFSRRNAIAQNKI